MQYFHSFHRLGYSCIGSLAELTELIAGRSMLDGGGGVHVHGGAGDPV